MKQFMKTLCIRLTCCLVSGILAITALAAEPSSSLTAVPTSRAVASGTRWAVDTVPIRINRGFLYQDVYGTARLIPYAKVTAKYSNGSTYCTGTIKNGVLTLDQPDGTYLSEQEYTLEIECKADSDDFPIFSCRNSQLISIRPKSFYVGTDGITVAAIDGEKDIVVPLEISFTAYAMDGARYPSPLMENISWQLINSSGEVTMSGENCSGAISLTFPWEDHALSVWCDKYQDLTLRIYPDFDADGFVTLSGASRPETNPNLKFGMYINSFGMVPKPDIPDLYALAIADRTVEVRWWVHGRHIITAMEGICFDIIITNADGVEVVKLTDVTCDGYEEIGSPSEASGGKWYCYKQVEMPIDPTFIPVTYQVTVKVKTTIAEAASGMSDFFYSRDNSDNIPFAHPISASYDYRTGALTWTMNANNPVGDVIVNVFYNASRPISDFTLNSPDLITEDSSYGLNPMYDGCIDTMGVCKCAFKPNEVLEWSNGYWAITVSSFSPDAVGKIPVYGWTIGVNSDGGVDIEQPSGGDDYIEPSGSYSREYAVSIPSSSSANGKVTVSPSRASKGEKVTLSVTPDNGYELTGLTITDKNGGTVKLTPTSEGRYTFTMPASQVTVKAAFTEIQEVFENPFADVAEDVYYYDAVAWAVTNGITSGTSTATFSPDAACTRAQAMTFLWKAAGAPDPKSTVNPFVDVLSSDYYCKAVLWAVEQGITSGTSAATFGSGETCTRAQIMTFLYRAAGTATAGSNSFTDVADSAYYYDAVAWAVAEGVTSGTGESTFSPDQACTRAQIMTFLYKCYSK